MKTSLKWLATSSVVALLAIAGPAQAYVIGRAVINNGSSTNVTGVTNGDGSINFYALLNTNGTLNNSSTAGRVADTCTVGSYSDGCTGGYLTMWLRFVPDAIGASLLTLAFEDLDLNLPGVNDPIYFTESISVYRGSSSTALGYTVVSADDDYQRLSVALDVANTNPLWVRLRFGTQFASNTPRGTHTNTPERVLATLGARVSVPEPATLSMLGAGLLLMGFATRRKIKQA